jgi:hypothetical protein
MTIVTVESEDNNIHTSQNGKIMVVGKTKKEWIKLPKQLGGKKSKVVDSFICTCYCNKHKTELYVLEADYVTMCCESMGWPWVQKPDKNALLKLKNAN